MKISNTQYPPLNFGTSYRKVHSPTFTLGDCYEASTCFFKGDFQWNKFFNHVIKKYKNTPKVNIFSLAGSDGSEAYSIAMLLISKLGQKADKYFPIIAVDFDPVITKNAQKGFMNLSAEDEVLINKYTENKLNTFFERTGSSFPSGKMGGSDKQVTLTRFKTKPILRDKVVFVTENLNSYVDKLPQDNNLIFCRNCWPYLWKTKEEFAQKISNKTGVNSYLITGQFDTFLCPMTNCNCYGFSMNKDFVNVFDKSGSNYFDPNYVIKMFIRNKSLYKDDI